MTFPITKHEALDLIRTYATHYKLSLEDIAAVLATEDKDADHPGKTGQIMVRILSYIGGLLVFAGLGTYAGISWDGMSSFERVFITLGPGIATLILALVCLKDGKYEKAATPLLIISAILQPTGLLVYLKEFFPPSDNQELAIGLVFSFLALQQIALFKKFNRTTLLLFSVMFGFTGIGSLLMWLDADIYVISLLLAFSGMCITAWINTTDHRVLTPWLFLVFGWSFITALQCTLIPRPMNIPLIVTAGALYGATALQLVSQFTTPRPYILSITFMAFFFFIQSVLIQLDIPSGYTSLIAASGGLAVAYGLRETMHRKLTQIFYVVFGFLLSLAVYELTEKTPLDIIMIGYGAVMMYISVVIASRVLLAVSVISLLSFLTYFTSTYFADVVGWPIAMIVFGLVLILISAYAMKLSQKMVTTKP